MESAAVTVRIAATVSRGDLMERTALTEKDVARQGTTPVISSVTSADLTEKVALTTTKDAHSEKDAHAEKDARSERIALTERVVLTEKTVVRQAKEDRHADLVRIHVRDSNPAVRAAHSATERGRKLQARDQRDPARAVSTRIPTKESRE